jgi:tetratricopeptide (TPR) repeat protein
MPKQETENGVEHVDYNEVPELPPPPDFKFSDVIDNMNAILASVGGSVEIKRKKANGVVEKIDDQEGSLKVADFRLKARATQHSMSKLTYQEKKKWVMKRKDEGNVLYRNGNHEEAISRYMEAVMGVAIGETPHEKQDAILTLQIPLLSNLAACMMVRGQYGRARSLLDEAVVLLENNKHRIDATAATTTATDGGGNNLVVVDNVMKMQSNLKYIKVYTRRSKCFIHIGYLNKAINDLKKSLMYVEICNEINNENNDDHNSGNSITMEEKTTYAKLLKLKKKEIKKVLRDAKNRREKDKTFVKAMMSKTIVPNTNKNNNHSKKNETSKTKNSNNMDGKTSFESQEDEHVIGQRTEDEPLLSSGIDESDDEDTDDLYLSHTKYNNNKNMYSISWCWKQISSVICCCHNSVGDTSRSRLEKKKKT